MGFDAESSIFERDRRFTCLKLMLDAGADPSLQYYQSLDGSTFELELQYGTVVSKLPIVPMVNRPKHVQAAVQALLDLRHPCVSANAPIGLTFNYEEPPLLSVAEHFHCLFDHSLDMHEKVFLLLSRGADIAARNGTGETSLHTVLRFHASMEKSGFRVYQEEKFKDILMCMVTAGADVSASDDYRNTVSQTAVEYGHEEIWREVLADCGYNPDAVFCLEEDFACSEDHVLFWYNRTGASQKYLGKSLFSSATPTFRSTKLSFTEYGRQRKSLDCVRKVYNHEEINIRNVWRERDDFWEAFIESSDSEDYEWEGTEERRRTWKNRTKKARMMRIGKTTQGEYSDEDEEYNGDNTAEDYPELLHNGVYWQSVFR
jgi:hypothetical protein